MSKMEAFYTLPKTSQGTIPEYIELNWGGPPTQEILAKIPGNNFLAMLNSMAIVFPEGFTVNLRRDSYLSGIEYIRDEIDCVIEFLGEFDGEFGPEMRYKISPPIG